MYTESPSLCVPGEGPLPWPFLVQLEVSIAVALTLVLRLDVLADAVRKDLPPLLNQIWVLHMSQNLPRDLTFKDAHASLVCHDT